VINQKIGHAVDDQGADAMTLASPKRVIC
jgi:hypothetical protein